MSEEEDIVSELNKDIENAKANLVSKDTEDKIAKAKQEAKIEAEKEFAVNQRIKELEAEKEKLKLDLETREKESAEKIAKLAEKVNSYVESKAVVRPNSPFENTNNVEKLSDKDIDKIETGSLQAFLTEKVRKEDEEDDTD